MVKGPILADKSQFKLQDNKQNHYFLTLFTPRFSNIHSPSLFQDYTAELRL